MRWLAFTLLSLGLAGGALAQEVLKREPPFGSIRPGTTVLVDNGRCPKGQIMEVTGGSPNGVSGNTRGVPVRRQHRCITR